MGDKAGCPERVAKVAVSEGSMVTGVAGGELSDPKAAGTPPCEPAGSWLAHTIASSPRRLEITKSVPQACSLAPRPAGRTEQGCPVWEMGFLKPPRIGLG